MNVFAYGTLLFPEVARPVADIDQPGEPVTLSGYRRYEARTRRRGNYPAIVRDKQACVDGLVFRNLTDQQIQQLDEFEGIEDGLYLRASERIQIDNESIEVEVYVAGPGLEQRLLEPLSKSWSPVQFQNNELKWYVNHLFS